MCYLLLPPLEVCVAKAMLVRVVSGFVEVVHIQLTDERRKVVVFEKLWQYSLSKVIRLFHYESISTFIPANNVVKLGILQKWVR